jgi:hypothetical protein
MGVSIWQPEGIEARPTLATFDWGGISPVKTEPLIFRAISELIASQVLTQTIVTQLAGLQTGKIRGAQPFIGQNARADESGAFEDTAEPVRVLTQRVQELEKRLDEAYPKKTAAANR